MLNLFSKLLKKKKPSMNSEITEALHSSGSLDEIQLIKDEIYKLRKELHAIQDSLLEAQTSIAILAAANQSLIDDFGYIYEVLRKVSSPGPSSSRSFVFSFREEDSDDDLPN